MRRSGWVRLALRWTGTLLSLLIAVAFLLSACRAIYWISADLRHGGDLMLGAVGCSWRPEGWQSDHTRYPPQPGWHIGGYLGPTRLCWWILIARTKDWQSVSVPLWMPFAAIALLTAALWYTDRRRVARSFQRFLSWLTPTRPKRVTFWLVALFSVLHVLALFGSFSAYISTLNFLGKAPPDAVDHAVEWASFLLFWTTPLWGLLWAWCWTRLRNHLFRRAPGTHCLACGYDLTGNVSGRCSECGAPVHSGLIAGAEQQSS